MLAIELPTEGWLEGLGKGQSRLIQQLTEAGKTHEEIAEMWLSTVGSSSTAAFGAGAPIENFYGNVKNEFIAFICGDAKYESERAQAIQIWNSQGKVGLVSMTAALVAANVGLAAAAVVPVIALLFSLASKIGLSAFCTACNSSSEDSICNPEL